MNQVSSQITIQLLLLLAVAHAQGPLQNGTWNVSVWAAGATGEEESSSWTQAQVWTAGVFVGRVITDELGKNRWRGHLEYGSNLAVFVTSRPEVILGGGFEPIVLRWNFSRSEHLVPYIELAGGGLITASNLPPGNTSNFNFTTRGGGGVHIFTRPRRSWDIGVRYLHISNANLGDENPQFNGLQITVGYHWFK